MNKLIEKAMGMKKSRFSEPTMEEAELAYEYIIGNINDKQFALALDTRNSNSRYIASTILRNSIRLGHIELKMRT